MTGVVRKIDKGQFQPGGCCLVIVGTIVETTDIDLVLGQLAAAIGYFSCTFGRYSDRGYCLAKVSKSARAFLVGV